MDAAQIFTSPKYRRFTPVFIFLLSILATFLFTLLIKNNIHSRDTIRFNNVTDQAMDTIKDKVEIYTTLIRSADGLYAASQSVEPDEFTAFVQRLNIRKLYRGVQGIGFADYYTNAEKGAYMSMLAENGIDNITIRPANSSQAEHAVITFLEPKDARNKAALGYDMFSEPVRRAAMEQARDSGQPVASGKVALIQEISKVKQPGFLIYVPVYANNLPSRTVAEKRNALTGFVYAPFRFTDLVLGMFNGHLPTELIFRIYDGKNTEDKNLMFDLAAEKRIPKEWQPQLNKSIVFEFDSHSWTVVFSESPTFYISSENTIIPFIIFGGMLISLLLLVSSYLQIKAWEQSDVQRKTLELSERSLIKSMEERSRLERQKDDFISIASHELKTPLTTIKAFNQLLHRHFTAINDRIAIRYLSKMNGQIDKLTSLVYDLLDITRIQTGKLEFHQEIFRIDQLVHSVVEDMRHTTTDTIRVNGKTKHNVYADKYRIEQVITNLITNAIKYSPEKSPINVTLQESGNHIRIGVADYGIGISNKDQGKIFDRFYRVEEKNRKQPGLGLGLYISAEIIKRHEGRIWVESSKGKGSTFFFTLPFANKKALP